MSLYHFKCITWQVLGSGTGQGDRKNSHMVSSTTGGAPPKNVAWFLLAYVNVTGNFYQPSMESKGIQMNPTDIVVVNRQKAVGDPFL